MATPAGELKSQLKNKLIKKELTQEEYETQLKALSPKSKAFSTAGLAEAKK